MPNNNHTLGSRPPEDSHNPVPFDFVPFQNSVCTDTIDKWERVDGGGDLYSGSINYTLEVKTPIHIVGAQAKNHNHEIIQSSFLRRHGEPLIPGSELKGMLRAFFEALTNSWTSQITDEYNAEPGKRAYGFTALSNGSGPVIPSTFHPKISDNRIDLATFLFGAVFEGDAGNNAFPSRLKFEDIIIDQSFLNSDTIQLPDVPGVAFMGDPKPRINSWWYFKPKCMSKKIVNIHNRVLELTNFMGYEYWGRKFYYHQKPEHALRWYGDATNWPHSTQKKERDERFVVSNNYRSYPVEIVRENSRMEGRLYFENIPMTMLELMVISLAPGGMAHKLGYGQAFGLGSIMMKDLKVFYNKSTGFNTGQKELSLAEINCDAPCANQYAGRFLNDQALKWLKRILYYDEDFMQAHANIYTYPIFGPVLETCVAGAYPTRKREIKKADFAKVVEWEKVERAVAEIKMAASGDSIAINLKQAEAIAESLWNIKKTIHFRLYQKKSRLWPEIEKRG